MPSGKCLPEDHSGPLPSDWRHWLLARLFSSTLQCSSITAIWTLFCSDGEANQSPKGLNLVNLDELHGTIRIEKVSNVGSLGSTKLYCLKKTIMQSSQGFKGESIDLLLTKQYCSSFY